MIDLEKLRKRLEKSTNKEEIKYIKKILKKYWKKQ